MHLQTPSSSTSVKSIKKSFKKSTFIGIISITIFLFLTIVIPTELISDQDQSPLVESIERGSQNERKVEVDASHNSYLRNNALLNETHVASSSQVSQNESKSSDDPDKEIESGKEKTLDDVSMNEGNNDPRHGEKVISNNDLPDGDEKVKEAFVEHISKGVTPQDNLSKEEVRSTDNQHYRSDAIQIENDSKYPFTFAGCLMVKDDNQILPEWLAYHYTVMPLRHLIIGVDPMSYTQVERVVEKFQSIGMKIMLLTGNEYWQDGRWFSIKLKNFDPKNHTTAHAHNIATHRQGKFFDRCFRILGRQGFSHTMILDTDEFFTYNQEWKIEPEGTGNPELTSKVPKHVGRQNETLAHWIDSGIDPLFSKIHTDEHEGCMVIPRVLVSPEESPPGKTEMYLEDGFNASYYQTVLYQSRGVHKFQGMQFGKALLNMKQYKYNPCANPHLPFNACFSYGSQRAKPNLPWEYSIIVHHIIGSYELFTSLNPFRVRHDFDVRKDLILEHGSVEDVSKAGWVREFIKLVGKEKALELTQLQRIEASMEDAMITEKLRNKETVDLPYEWDEPKAEPHHEDEWQKFKFD